MVSEALDGLTDEQLAELELQESGLVSGQSDGTIASTPFAQRISPQPAVGPQAQPEPAALSDYELNKLEEENYRRVDYVMTPQEFDQYWDRREKEDQEVGRFIEGLGQGAAGLIGMVPEAGRELRDGMVGMVTDPVNQVQRNVQTGAEIVRKAGINLVQLYDWVGSKVDDLTTSSKRAEAINAGIRAQLQAEGRFTGDRTQDEQIYQAALIEARKAGAYKPAAEQVLEDRQKAYDRYVREKSIERDYAGVSQFKTGESAMSSPTSAETYQITDEKPMQTVSQLGAMAIDPVNLIPTGAGALSKARILRRMAVLSEKPLLGVERAAGGLADVAERVETGLSTRIQDITGLTQKQQAALGAGVAGTAVYVDSATESQGGLTKAVMMVGGVLPALHYGGGLLRKVGSAAGGASTIVREAGVGGLGVARAEAAAGLANNAAIPERYRKFFTGYVEGTDSTLKRVAQNADNPEALRRVSRFADRMGATQVARVADDAVSGAMTAGIVGTPFAALQPDAERAGEVMGGILALGAAGGVAGGLARRRSAEVVDADIARMFADVQASGGNVEAFSRLPHQTLDRLSAMQGVLAGKVDFIPLSGDEYRMNADIAQNAGETTAGVFVDKDANNRARVFINLDAKTKTESIAPHEIGHAILTSDILDGQPRADLRNLVNQQYGPEGVVARGREYIGRLIDGDAQAKTTGEMPMVLTEAEMAAVDGGKTMDDVVADRMKDPAERERLINERFEEFSQRSIDKGQDSLDWARDEIIAETFASEAPAIDFRAIRRDGTFPRIAESMLSAGGRVLEMFGANFSDTGRLLDNPSVLFRDNPLFQDRIMQKRVREYVRSYDQFLAGLEEAGSAAPRGVELARSNNPADLGRSTHVKLRDEGRGVLENDFLFQKPDGTYSFKPQKLINQSEASRAAQIKTLYDARKFVPVNSTEFGKRKVNGRETIGGPVLPPQFDLFTHFPKHVREFARAMEQSRAEGGSWDIDYNAIGTGSSGRYRIINMGAVRAIQRETVPFGWQVTKQNHLLAASLDLNAFRASAMKAINKGELGVFNNDMRQVEADLKTYLGNHRNGLPGEAGIGQAKRDMLNGLIGTGTAVQRTANPLYYELNPKGSIRTWRVDRLNDAKPTGRTGYFFDYDKINNNRMPQALPREAMGMPDMATGGTRGQAMPDVADAPPFYLKSSQAIDAKVQGKAATPDQIKAILTNPQNGIKAEELKWTGVMQEVERLAKENNGKVPKDALLRYLAEDGAVRLEEVRLGQDKSRINTESPYAIPEVLRYAQENQGSAPEAMLLAIENDGDVYRALGRRTPELLEREDWAQVVVNDVFGGGDNVQLGRYAQYQLPGGENYREVVLAMPHQSDLRERIIHKPSGRVVWTRDSEFKSTGVSSEAMAWAEQNIPPSERGDYIRHNPWMGREPLYVSSHFDEAPGYVAHMRLNERVDAKGKPGLFIEELQSDRHQQGREQGYKTEVAVVESNGRIVAKFENEKTAQQYIENQGAAGASLEVRSNSSGVPDAPFRTSWPLQLFKRALRDAVADGKEWIGWTTGETQAARYDLSKQISKVLLVDTDGGNQFLYAYGLDGNEVIRRDVKGENIADIIGKEAAEKLAKAPKQKQPNGASERSLQGVDLKVGGEGMKGFYDQILPKEISKYVKQWGAQVEKSKIKTPGPKKKVDDMSDAELVAELRRGEDAVIWRVNITPQMREGIKKAGQALFVGGAAAVVAEDQLEQ